MEVTYQLTADDFRHGMIAWRMKSRWRRWSHRIGLVVMPLLLIFNASLLLLHPQPQLKQIEWIGLGVSTLWLSYIWVGPWFSARMQFRRMPSAQDPITLAVLGSGLRVQSRHADSQIAWSAFIGWREEKSVFVVFTQPRLYVPIPKRAFTGEQQTEFRETLCRNILPFKSK
jgi:hypothetical protein